MKNLESLNEPAVASQIDNKKRVFGMYFTPLNIAEVAALIARPLERKNTAAKLFVTPNIQHISEMRSSVALRKLMINAALITCDGFPVAWFARLRGAKIAGRVTGREVVDELMNNVTLDASHRLFFLLDSEETAIAVRRWNNEVAPHIDCQIEVAPMGFGEDKEYCINLAKRMAEFRASIGLLCLGAPRSECFADQYAKQIPDCWLMCIGQSVRVALKLVDKPPKLMVNLQLEWLWRILLEPRRMISRYVRATFGFLIAAVAELAGRGFQGSN